MCNSIGMKMFGGVNLNPAGFRLFVVLSVDGIMRSADGANVGQLPVNMAECLISDTWTGSCITQVQPVYGV